MANIAEKYVRDLGLHPRVRSPKLPVDGTNSSLRAYSTWIIRLGRHPCHYGRCPKRRKEDYPATPELKPPCTQSTNSVDLCGKLERESQDIAGGGRYNHNVLGSPKRKDREETTQRQLKSIVILGHLQAVIRSFYKDQTGIPIQT